MRTTTVCAGVLLILSGLGSGRTAFADFVYSTDFTQNGGTLGESGVIKVYNATSPGPLLQLTNGATTSGITNVMIGATDSGGSALADRYGRLSIESGSVFANAGHVTIGNSTGTPGAIGAATVTGSGSQWNVTSSGTAGFRLGIGTGTGTLTVESGGAVTTEAMFVSGYDNNSNSSSGGGTATVNINSGGTLTSAGQSFYVGANGGTGTVNLSTGNVGLATLSTSSSNVVIGASDNATGTVTVSGVGAVWNNSGGRMRVGDQGVGLLQIQAGGVVNQTSSGSGAGQVFTIGYRPRNSGSSALAKGTVLVTGSGSQLNLSGGLTSERMRIGGYQSGISGDGLLTVDNSGVVKVGDTGIGLISIYATGKLAGAGGTVQGSVTSEGFIRPGTGDGSTTVGTLSVTGNLTSTGAGKLAFDLASAGSYDQLIVGGDVSLNSSVIDVSLLGGYTPATNTIFTILQRTGSFSGTPSFNFTNSAPADWFTGNFASLGQIQFVGVPEPASISLMLFAVFGLRWFRCARCK